MRKPEKYRSTEPKQRGRKRWWKRKRERRRSKRYICICNPESGRGDSLKKAGDKNREADVHKFNLTTFFLSVTE